MELKNDTPKNNRSSDSLWKKSSWKIKNILRKNSWEIIDFLKDLVTIIVIVVIIRSFIAMPFQINWQSMYESYYDKEFIIVDRLSYNIGSPKRWDVVVFRPNISRDKEYFLKRIIWVSWDKIKIDDWKVYLNKKGLEEYVLLDEKYLNKLNKNSTYVSWSQNKHEYIVPEWEYFVMWDNRNHSTDSRQCFSSCLFKWTSNFVKEQDLIWKLFIDLGYFNFKSFSFMQPNLWITTLPRFLNTPKTYEY